MNKSDDGEVLLHGVYTHEYTIMAEEKALQEGMWSLRDSLPEKERVKPQARRNFTYEWAQAIPPC